MDIKDFKVGQTVYVRLYGNAAEGKSEDKIIEEWIVTKVGKKYLYAKPKEGWGRDVIFEKRRYDDNFVNKTEYSISYVIYLDKQDILDEMEYFKLSSFIENEFRYSQKQYSLDQLRRIKAIIDEKE